MKHWALLLGKDFDKATKEDIMRAVRAVQETEKYSPWTKSTYKTMLKRFFKWLKKEENPEEIAWIKCRIKLTEKRLPQNNDLLTEEEVQKLVSLAEHPRDKAFIATLYESGTRIGELASLQIKNINFDEYGAVLNVHGKTGSRPVRIISSTPHLVTLLQNHPLRNDPTAPLWICIGTTNHNKPLKYQSIRVMLMRLFEKAQIKKRFNPHMFRHSRATFLADHLTEFQMNQYFGWIQGSKMPSTYIHMSGKKIDSSILALNGIEQKENHKERKLKPKICPRCDTINTSEARFCTKCAGILDLKTAQELEKRNKDERKIRDKSDNIMQDLLSDKEFYDLFIKKVKELRLKERMIT